ncbi:MAG TPA: hypothetical protein VKG38_11995, partial [Solirubrobacteraceae bacterium]|nr:hypothetical protein [Solirubrobacteraceae bacterium]
TLVVVDEQLARDAADLRARRYHRTRSPVSLADCILLAATGASDELVTADRPLLRVAELENVRTRALSS